MSEQILQGLKDHIDEFALLSADAWNELEQIVRISDLKNEDFLVREGGLATDEVYLARGILRAFYRSYDGEEVNVAFFTENHILPPHYFRTKNRISQLNIQALSDAIIVKFDSVQFTDLRVKHESLFKYGNLVVERELDNKTQREILLLTKSAEERYQAFRELYPGLENYISQYQVASYLGITPVSLSRIRKSLLTK